MMVEALKNRLYCVLSCALVGLFCVLSCGCSNNPRVINTHSMPGHKVGDILRGSAAQKVQKDSPLTRTKSGVYIYKDTSVVNTAGYNFQFKEKTQVGPSDVRFDAEHFKTRY